MKRYCFLLSTILVAMATVAQPSPQLVILHTNDTHSCIFPLDSTLSDTLLAGRGGFLRRLAMIQEERAAHPSLLLIDSGDFSQGSPYYTLFKGDVEVDLMNAMGYDVATIGNHEFDGGLDNMARLFQRAAFPIVCANYDFSGTPVEGLVQPYIVITREGLRIGLFGLSPELEGLVAEDNYRGVTVRDPIATANEMAQTLRKKEHCDIVICVSHLGWNDGARRDESSLSSEPQPIVPEGNEEPGYTGDNQVIAATTGIDLFLGGHSHTYLQQLEYIANAEGHPVAVDQNGKHGVFVGKIIVDVAKKK